MAHHSSHRRILAAPNPQTPMDPTSRKPKSTTTTTTVAATVNHRQPPPLIHPVPDPTVTTTIQNISHRFSKLYINHKKKNSFKPHPHPQPDPPSIQEQTSCTTLTKSSSQHERSVEKFHFLSTKVKVKGKDDFKKKYPKKKQSLEEFDVVKNISFSSKNEEIIVKGRNSLSSIPPALVNGGERRRSFCCSQVELADFFSVNSVKVVAVDMPPFMQFHAVDCARKTHDSLEKFTSKTLALTLKKEFDGVYGPAWHCIVGTSFGSFVTHSVGGFMYFSMDQKLYILLFKTTVQRAE